MRTLAVVPLLALLAACSKPGDTDRAPAPAAESATSGVIAKGSAYKESDYKVPGKIVLLDFYADW